MKIFISHASKDGDIATAFSNFLECIHPMIQVFCSSQIGSIKVGSNFAYEITKQLDNCDVFIPLISSNYYNSRFCMVELGFAYAILFHEHGNEDDYIFPIAIPPIKKAEALSKTPLEGLQVASIHSVEEMRGVLESILAGSGIPLKSGFNKRMIEFVQNAKGLLFDQCIVETQSQHLVCKSSNVPGEDSDYLSHHALTSHNGYEIKFCANPFGNGSVYPDFLSFVYQYPDQLNLLNVVNLFSEAYLQVVIDNVTNSVSKIDIEIKHSDNNLILNRRTVTLQNGTNVIRIPLGEMRSNALERISEICFVLKPSAYIMDAGTLQIYDFKLFSE